jgi:hypothetical protein
VERCNATRFTYGQEIGGVLSTESTCNGKTKDEEARDLPASVETNTHGRNVDGYEGTRVGMAGTRPISRELLVAGDRGR